MTFESQFCSYDLSKRIDALGVKRECLFRYAFYKGKWAPVYVNDLRRGTSDPLTDFIPAYTVAELGEMLPELTHTVKERLSDRSFRWHCYVAGRLGKDTQEGWSEADARAKMLIHLLENKLVTL